jgi:poly-gamma-glutamate synthesis protein (capsule biosynthesis protein)
VFLAGGDVELGRAMGKRLLRDPFHAPFASVSPLLEQADVRFVNLEGPLSDQKGETMSPSNMLVFTGPPSGADALARAGITVVSTANNHAWDYGKNAALETLAHLDRVGVAHTGTGPTLDDAWRPALMEAHGVRIAVFAVTDIWNQGPLEGHEGRNFVAQADLPRLADAIKTVRTQVDAVLVSYHGGVEYQDMPTPRTRAFLSGAIDAGADAVIGHHPHVIQGIAWHGERPILYSLGNLLMQMHRDHPWTGFGFFARLTFVRGVAPDLAICPYRIHGLVPLLLVRDENREALERVFFAHLRALSPGVEFGSSDPSGCSTVGSR